MTESRLEEPGDVSTEELAARILARHRPPSGVWLLRVLYATGAFGALAYLFERSTLGVLLPTLGVLLGCLGLRRTLGRQRAAEASVTLQEQGAPYLRPFTELLQWPDARVRQTARWWLTANLPRLDPNALRDLGSAHRAILYECLRPWSVLSEPALAESVLSVLPALEDEEGLRAVLRLIRARRLPGRRYREVRLRALATLPVLERAILATRLSAAAESASREAEASEAPVAVVRMRDELGQKPQMRLGFLVAAWAVIVPGGLSLCLQSARQGDWPLAILYAAAAVAATQLHRLTLFAHHARLVRSLLREKDVSAVGRLAEASLWPSPQVQAAALGALTRLLPMMKASDAHVLTTYQRQCLYALLQRGNACAHPEAAIALLRALEQIGDVAAIRPVRDLASMPETSARAAAVRRAAHECLPALLECARRNTDPQVLLRPAGAPTDEADLLLRPLEAGVHGDERLLVRPAIPEGTAEPADFEAEPLPRQPTTYDL